MTSGEAGLITTNNATIAARCVLMSGSCMLYGRHGAAPSPDVFENLALDVPNMPGRMDNLHASIPLPQIATPDANVERWNERYRTIERRLADVAGIETIGSPEAERFVGSSIQFRLRNDAPDDVSAFIAANARLGVELKWFGADRLMGCTSTHRSWRHVAPHELPGTAPAPAGPLDTRIPLTFSLANCEQVAGIISHCAATTG